ncbi:hypothetical protein TKK_0000771 [Trichogramma kaykai]|uniref:Uncharacterized protein n=1 Tax=Trichogramma kaykai TaxID=54128 RepID=A0ABD2WQX8_9HYME
MSDSESSDREFDYSIVTSDREIGDSRRSEDESCEIFDDEAVANSVVEPEELEEGDEGFPAEDDRGDDESEEEDEFPLSKDELAALIDRSIEFGESSDDFDYEPPCESEEIFDDGTESDHDARSDFERRSDNDEEDDDDVNSENFASGGPSECDEYGETSDYDDSRNNSGID